MIPREIQEWIFPQVADGTEDAAVLRHDCGVDFQFYVDQFSYDSTPAGCFVVTNQHLRLWRTTLDKLSELAGHNCFSYNMLQADLGGVYHDHDSNTFAILFGPGTFLEHNEVDGRPLFLVISASECILTGSRSETGTALLREHLGRAVAKRVVTIDSKWRKWVSDDGLSN